MIKHFFWAILGMVFLFIAGSVCMAADAGTVNPVPVIVHNTNFMAIMQNILICIVTIFGGILTVSLKWIIPALLKKYGIEIDSGEAKMINAFGENAANWAIHWASTQAIKPTHNAMVDAGFAHFNEIASDPLIQTYGIIPLRNLISAKIQELVPTDAIIVNTNTAAQ